MKGALMVGRASAGSGKTFTLTLEYIRLLVENPDNYRHILAVTFTNKATAELKSRIVDTLHAIATGKDKAQPYTDKLLSATTDLPTLRQRTATALTNILHDYSHFRVETIDSFFQSIIRDLARELNLTANLRVDIEADEALEEAVSLMIENMRQGDPTFNAVVGYIGEKMNREKPGNWKIDKELTEFCRNIFNEQYLKAEKQIRAASNQPNFYTNYKQTLTKMRHDCKQARLDLAQAFKNHIDTFGLQPDQFVGGKSGVYAYFPKVADGKTPAIPKALTVDPNAPWLKDAKLNLQHIGFFKQLMDHEMQLRKTLATTTAILRHTNQMQLLNKVDDTLRQQNEQHNRFILADSAHRLQEIMTDTDVPFIMEKAAAQFRYIMIDEFQDTSELQWENFQPLIKECLAAGCRCIIVGDVKQSIYRWRNSDWSILNNIGQQPAFASQVEEDDMRRALDTNRRSDQHIVEFNNKFFKQASQDATTHYDTYFKKPQGTTTDITTAYAELEQKTVEAKRRHGFVSIADITTPPHSPEQDSTDNMLQAVEATIRHLTNDCHLEYSDIAILTRHNKELKLITRHLKEQIPDIEIVSNETFQLDYSPAVDIIILGLQVVAGTQNKMWRFYLGTLAYKYQQMVRHNNQADMSLYYQSDIPQLSRLLPEGFVDSIARLQVMPLHELCEQIYQTFQLADITGQDAYLFTFFDELHAYVSDKAADINSFVEYWNDKLSQKTIPAEGARGIQMLTIHKSKGLEFHTVIVPFCNWNMGGRASVMWCHNNNHRADNLPVIPITFGKDLAETDFNSDYETEELKNYVDNLNLMYVAFTRASHNLFVLTEKPAKSTSYNTYQVISEAISHTYGKTTDAEGNTSIDLTIGEIEPHTDNARPADTNIAVGFGTGGIEAEFRQSNASKEFTVDPDAPEAERQNYIKRGLIVHKIFETIRTRDDIPQVIRAMQQEGIMADEEFRLEIENDIERAISNRQVSRWFLPHWNVMNESSIVVRDTDGTITTRRPDRVIYDDNETIVIDYKTGTAHPDHLCQVGQYMALLKNMGMPHVKGYIWYMRSNTIKEVTHTWNS